MANLSNGFSQACVNKSRKLNQNLKNLISGLEKEEPGQSLQVEDGGDIVMRMVEDFGLMSESDSDDESDNTDQVVCLDRNAVFRSYLNFLQMVETQRSHVSKPNTILIEDREPRDGRVTEEDLILREMLARFEKLENGKCEDKFAERFENPRLVELVKKVRRESKVSKKFSKSLKKKKSRKGRILQRCNYLVVSPEEKPSKPYQCFRLSENSRSPRKLEGPSREDMLLARKMNKIDPDIADPFQETEEFKVPANLVKRSQTVVEENGMKVELEESVGICEASDLSERGRNCDMKSSQNVHSSEETAPGKSESNSVENSLEDHLKSANDQFDVEVAYCDNIEVLNVDNETLFLIDNSTELNGHSEDLKVPDKELEENLEASVEESSEKIEDIKRFLAESQDKSSLDEGSKIETQPKLEFTKESALKIISKSSVFMKNNVKKSAKVHSFEEALNAALTPTKKIGKPVISKPVKSVKPVKSTVQQAVVIPSTKVSESKLPKSTKLLSPVKSLETSPKKINSQERTSPKKISLSKTVDVVSKIISQIDQTKGHGLTNEKKPEGGTLLSSVTKSGPRQDDVVRVDSKRMRLDSSSSSLPQVSTTSPISQEIFDSLKKTFLPDNQDLSLTSPVKYPFPKPTQSNPPGVVNGVDLPQSPVKVQGYYTSSRSAPTLLPTVFPTFDCPHSSQGEKWTAILHSGSKPTAVVPPSARAKMPALPKPVPASLGQISDR